MAISKTGQKEAGTNCTITDGPFGRSSVVCGEKAAPEQKKAVPADTYTDRKQAPPLPKGTDCFKTPTGMKCR